MQVSGLYQGWLSGQRGQRIPQAVGVMTAHIWLTGMDDLTWSACGAALRRGDKPASTDKGKPCPSCAALRPDEAQDVWP